jgi:hypothetical protein
LSEDNSIEDINSIEDMQRNQFGKPYAAGAAPATQDSYNPATHSRSAQP